MYQIKTNACVQIYGYLFTPINIIRLLIHLIVMVCTYPRVSRLKGHNIKINKKTKIIE